MNILIAGYGNIGKAIHSLLKKYPIDNIENIYIAEIEEGLDAESGILKYNKQLDIVVNAVPEDNESIVQMCEKHGIHYIDTGFELTYKIKDIMKPNNKSNSQIKKMWGFGMNPGLIEYMYRKQNLTKKHIVIEFETDTAASAHFSGVFNTWSPETYITESSIETPYAYVNGLTRKIERNKTGADIELFFDGVKRKYLWIPHEELYSIANSNNNCV